LIYVLYFLIAILATTSGAIAGISGGIVIRPLLDVLDHFDVQTISVLSSLTILSMSLVAAGKQIHQKATIKFKIVIPLAIGSALGGIIGQQLLAHVIGALEVDRIVTVIQNSILLLIAITVFLYIKNRDKIKGHSITNPAAIVISGLSLGIIAAFLGIGGGPLNVAILVFLFSLDIKTATVGSIVIILFSQTANAIVFASTIGFGGFDLRMLPPMIAGATIGGFIGAGLNKKLSEKTVENFFRVMLSLVAVFSIYNIVRGLFLI